VCQTLDVATQTFGVERRLAGASVRMAVTVRLVPRQNFLLRFVAPKEYALKLRDQVLRVALLGHNPRHPGRARSGCRSRFLPVRTRRRREYPLVLYLGRSRIPANAKRAIVALDQVRLPVKNDDRSCGVARTRHRSASASRCRSVARPQALRRVPMISSSGLSRSLPSIHLPQRSFGELQSRV
jgi:hypothetical protein